MSSRLFYVIAVVAVIATVAGVLVWQGRDPGSGDTTFAGADDPVLDAKIRNLQFYDWETNVIGPDGRPAPGDPKVTGATRAGRSGALTLYDAVKRAARRPSVLDDDNGRTFSEFFAIDEARKKVFGRGTKTRAKARALAPGATVVEVRPGTAIVGADDSASRWYVIDDNVAVSGTQISEARQGTDQSSGRPVTLFAFTDTGLQQFRRLTRTIAARGSQSALDSGDVSNPTRHNQHFAVVYLGRIVTAPAVDFQRSPDGLDARAGTQLAEQLP